VRAVLNDGRAVAGRALRVVQYALPRRVEQQAGGLDGKSRGAGQAHGRAHDAIRRPVRRVHALARGVVGYVAQRLDARVAVGQQGRVRHAQKVVDVGQRATRVADARRHGDEENLNASLLEQVGTRGHNGERVRCLVDLRPGVWPRGVLVRLAIGNDVRELQAQLGVGHLAVHDKLGARNVKRFGQRCAAPAARWILGVLSGANRLNARKELLGHVAVQWNCHGDFVVEQDEAVGLVGLIVVPCAPLRVSVILLIHAYEDVQTAEELFHNVEHGRDVLGRRTVDNGWIDMGTKERVLWKAAGGKCQRWGSGVRTRKRTGVHGHAGIDDKEQVARSKGRAWILRGIGDALVRRHKDWKKRRLHEGSHEQQQQWEEQCAHGT